jgi:hypothetical protein
MCYEYPVHGNLWRLDRYILGWNFLHFWWNNYTAVNLSSLPRLWEQSILWEGEYYCWIGNILLRITTHQWNLNFLNRLWRDPQIIFIKIRAVGHEFFNADGETFKHNLIDARNQSISTVEGNNCLFREHTKTCLYDIWYIFINCNWVVTRWQYAFTHERYIEQHK